MPMCRSAFSEALNLGRVSEPPLRLSAAAAPAALELAPGFAADVAVGGGDDAPMWVLDASN